MRPDKITPADHRIVSPSTFHHQYAGQIVHELVTSYLAADGYSAPLDLLVLGSQIEQVSFHYISLAEALSKLSELSGCEWWIDDEKQFHFGHQTA